MTYFVVIKISNGETLSRTLAPKPLTTVNLHDCLKSSTFIYSGM